MKSDQEKTTEKTEAPLCIKHKLPINLDLGMCEDCAIYLHDKVLANMGEPEFYFFPADEEE
jgi:hypothetical protein